MVSRLAKAKQNKLPTSVEKYWLKRTHTVVINIQKVTNFTGKTRGKELV